MVDTAAGRPTTVAFVLSLAFAMSLMAGYSASWLVLGRHWSPSVSLSVALIGLAGLSAGLAAGVVLPRAPLRAYSAKFALAALVLLSVTGGTLTLLIAVADMILSPGDPPSGLGHRIEWALLTTAASFYMVLGLVARLLLPAGLVAVPLFSWAFARLAH